LQIVYRWVLSRISTFRDVGLQRYVAELAATEVPLYSPEGVAELAALNFPGAPGRGGGGRAGDSVIGPILLVCCGVRL